MFGRAVLCVVLVGCSEFGFTQRPAVQEPPEPPPSLALDTALIGTPQSTACIEGGVVWELEEAWRMRGRSRAIAVGRMFDGDGDGDVDLDDPPTIVSSELGLGGDTVEYFGYGEDSATTVISGAVRSPARLGDLDGAPGAEIAVAWHVSGEANHRASVIGGRTAVEHRMPNGATSTPWLADVDFDGRTDILVNGGAVDALSGDVARRFRAVGGGSRSVAMDLDLDGVAEVISALPQGRGVVVGLLGANDEITRPCLTVENDWRRVRFAVGNLDFDDDGEFVVASGDVIAICDSDGSLIQSISTDLDEPAMLGIADFDGDDSPEIVVTGMRGPINQTTPRLAVFDRSLRFQWERVDGPWFFSLADLDGNGTHELLLQGTSGFRIVDGNNQLLAQWSVAIGEGALAQPVVADVDQDGLAEIVLPHSEGVVLETPLGGFPTVGAPEGWTGVDHFPGLMAADGSLSTVGAHWLEPGGNAWQGHARCVPEPDEDG